MQFFADDSPPVGVQRNIDGWVVEDSWCPLDGVDFGHQCTVDYAGGVEELVTGRR